MKKFLLGLCLLAIMSSTLSAKGGVGPFLASCFLGPRVGLEMNDGSQVRTMEWIALAGNLVCGVGGVINGIEPAMGRTMNEARSAERLGGTAVRAVRPKEKGGVGPFLAGCCLGPRVGLELNDGRNIRLIEWLCLIPLVRIVPAIEAASGRTMSEITITEGLDR